MQGKVGYFCERTVEYSYEKNSFDIRITRILPQSYSDKPFGRSTNNHGKEKDKHNQRIINIEKSSFNKLWNGTRMCQGEQKTSQKMVKNAGSLAWLMHL